MRLPFVPTGSCCTPRDTWARLSLFIYELCGVPIFVGPRPTACFVLPRIVFVASLAPLVTHVRCDSYQTRIRWCRQTRHSQCVCCVRRVVCFTECTVSPRLGPAYIFILSSDTIPGTAITDGFFTLVLGVCLLCARCWYRASLDGRCCCLAGSSVGADERFSTTDAAEGVSCAAIHEADRHCTGQ